MSRSDFHLERIHARDLFVTDDFRYSAWVQGICDEIGEVWVTDQEMPKGHFGTYFGVITRRGYYENKSIQDCYHLHELIHWKTLNYKPGDSFMNWSRRVIRSEREASLATEVWVYYHIPGLRSKTFAHEIWFDRYAERARLSWTYFEAIIRHERDRALNTPDFDDFLEWQIRNYGLQNAAWCDIWSESADRGPESTKTAFRVVEEHMASPTSRDFETHRAWLIEHSTVHNGHLVPFLKQALAFEAVHLETFKRYGNHHLTR